MVHLVDLDPGRINLGLALRGLDGVSQSGTAMGMHWDLVDHRADAIRLVGRGDRGRRVLVLLIAEELFRRLPFERLVAGVLAAPLLPRDTLRGHRAGASGRDLLLLSGCGRGRALDSLTFALLGGDGLALGRRFLGRGLALRVHCRLWLLEWSVLRHGLRRGLRGRSGVVGVIGVLVGSTGLLLVSRIQREGEALAASLIVGGRLRHLLLEVLVRDIVVVDAGRGRGARLDSDRIHILNLRDLDLLLPVLTGRAATSHLCRRIRAIPAATAAHQGGVVTELEALVGLTGADGGFVVRADLAAGEPLLQLGRAIERRATALDLLLGLSLDVRDSRLRRGVRWDGVAHLRGGRLLGCTTTALLLDLDVMSAFVRRLDAL